MNIYIFTEVFYTDKAAIYLIFFTTCVQCPVGFFCFIISEFGVNYMQIGASCFGFIVLNIISNITIKVKEANNESQ